MRSRRWWPRSSKWAAMAASIWIQCTAGSSYCFGIYSPILKSSQSYDQSTLDSVAFFKDVGANAGLLSGLLYSVSSPALVHAVGAAQCFAGYFLMWLSVTGTLPRQPVPLMCFYMFLAAHAQTFFNTANVVTAAESFPDNRGTAVGIMKGFLGLSGAILIQVYQTMYEGQPGYFLLVLALLPTIVPLLLMCLVRIHCTNGRDDKRLLDRFSLVSLIIAGYLMVVIISGNVRPLALSARIFTLGVLLLLLTSPMGIVFLELSRDSMIQAETSYHERTRLVDDTDPLEAEDERKDEHMAAGMTYSKDDHVAHGKMRSYSGHEKVKSDKIILARGENLNLLQALWTIDFWLLFLAMACGMGSGLATVNNISQIGGSLGYKVIETSTLVSLWSIWNFLGRFGAGYISDYFLLSRGYARPLFMAITLATMSVGHAVISSAMPGALYVGSILVGICYGSQWSLMPTITSEVFGIRHMGTIFNTISIASPVGSYILSVRVVGYIYDMEASLSDTKACLGARCFMLSFLIMAFVSLFGFMVALALFFRTRKFYEQVIVPRLRHSALA